MMDVVQIFNDELQSLLDTKPPVSKAKMGLITRAAMKGVKFYKHIVQSVEKFILKSSSEYKVPGLYVIDSIVRQSRHQFGIERDVYATRFSRNLQLTFSSLFSGCLPEDRPKIVRVLNLWQKNGVFNSQVIQPLLDMAQSGSTLPIDPNSLSAVSPDIGLDNSLGSKHGHSSSNYHRHQYKNPTDSIARHQRNTADGGLKFNKDMLDFDYDEDDDDDGDETPTEAEPPLSSTLSKIEMEQRGHRNDMAGNKLPNQLHSARHADQQNDPVLERWNRLIKQRSNKNEVPNGEVYHQQQPTRDQRSRSRSPPPPNQVFPHHQQYQDNQRGKTHESSKESAHQKGTTMEQDNNHPQSIEKSNRNAEREAEREKKCLPKIRDKHLTVCSSTLWLGHVPKTVSEADISDAFGEYGTITSIDLIPPRGCAYVCMDRRQDAKRALTEARNLKLNGSHIRMAWAPGKGFKEYKKLKDFWEADTGSSFIPYSRVDETIDFSVLEEGGVIDEDSMSMDMRERRERMAKEKEHSTQNIQPALELPLPTIPILSNPPPPTSSTATTIPPFAMPNLSIPPPPTGLLGQGVIPFPPPTSVIPPTSSSGNQMAHQHHLAHTNNLSEYQDHNRYSDSNNNDNSIDQQLSMTERQISMVEQQLNMIQHAQGMAQPTSMPSAMPTHTIIQQNQLNPMMFDLAMPQMLHPAQQIFDPLQMAMFTNQAQMLGQGPPMQLAVNQANTTDLSNMHENQQHY